MSVFRLGLAVIAVVAAGLFLVYGILDPISQACHSLKEANPSVVCGRYAELGMVLTLISTALLTLFGTLALPGAQDQSGAFAEQRIRVAVAMSVLALYIVYFSMAVFWTTPDTNPKMVETLTNLLMVVIPFYFGASAFTQVAKRKDENAKTQ